MAPDSSPGSSPNKPPVEGRPAPAVYLATPTGLHPEHVKLACAAGKHVLVEKPMAAELAEARAMIAAAREAGVVLLVGHSHSYDLPIKRMREIIAGGTLGRVRMVNTWCFTDWVHRPRRPDELDAAQGGGVTLRQGSHQFDIIRLLCGGMARSVRAKTFDWDPARRANGAHVVYLDFEDGAAATAVYNGYGSFSSMELGFDVSEWGFMQPGDPSMPRRRASAGQTPEDELRAKQKRAEHAIPGSAPYQPFFGLTVVSCERGDLRQSPQGLYVYTEEGRSEIKLPSERSPRELVLDEFHDALSGNAPALHDGRWGLANLEVCSAALMSSASGHDVLLHEQVPIPLAT
jgi:phthalate 4,5-cis-dihydrodiol dehydrogenase